MHCVSLRLICVLLIWMTGALSASPTAHSRCTAGVRIVDGVKFTVQCGVDRSAEEKDFAVRTTYEQCAKACARDSKCLTAQYYEGHCSKKRKQNQLVLVDRITTFDKGNACTLGVVEGLTVHCNTSTSGSDLDDSSYTGSYAACAALCSSNRSCLGAEYNFENGFCSQKSHIKGHDRHTTENVVSLVHLPIEQAEAGVSILLKFLGLGLVLTVLLITWQFRKNARKDSTGYPHKHRHGSIKL